MKVKSLKEDYEKSLDRACDKRKEKLLSICNDVYAYCINNIENKIPLPYCVNIPLVIDKEDMEVLVNMLRNDYLIESRFIYWNLYVEEFL